MATVRIHGFAATMQCFQNCASPNATLNTLLNGKGVSGTYTYDDAVVPTSGDPSTFRDYGSGFGVSMNIGNGMYILSVANAAIEIARNHAGNGQDAVYMYNLPNPSITGSSAAQFPSVTPNPPQSWIHFNDTAAGNILPNTLIASWPQTVAAWTSPAFAGVEFYVTDNVNIVGFRGAFTTLNAGGGPMDVDGNGAYDALTDGVLIMRYMFGLRGASLLVNAVAPDATRTTAQQIESYLAQQMP